jgi:predicted lactoylglutathione lyase
MLPSSRIPFLNVRTDGKAKARHNREILFVLAQLRQAGITDYCLHHIDDAGMDRALPLTLNNKWYDISYVAPDGEIFLIEIMRTRIKKPKPTTEKA